MRNVSNLPSNWNPGLLPSFSRIFSSALNWKILTWISFPSLVSFFFFLQNYYMLILTNSDHIDINKFKFPLELLFLSSLNHAPLGEPRLTLSKCPSLDSPDTSGQWNYVVLLFCNWHLLLTHVFWIFFHVNIHTSIIFLAESYPVTKARWCTITYCWTCGLLQILLHGLCLHIYPYAIVIFLWVDSQKINY